MPDPTTKNTGFTSPNTLSSPPKGKNYLLAIGIDKYTHLPPLFNAAKDAQDVVALLQERFQFDKSRVTELYNEKATKRNIIKAFRSFVEKVTKADNFLVYFSGHGEYDKVFKIGSWIPVEAEKEATEQYIDNGLIKNILGAIDSHHTFMMIDSCFSGTLFTTKGVNRNISLRKEKDPSRWGLTAGRQEVVVDGQRGENSPFAESILYQLKNTERPIGVAELCDKVLEVVAANAHQTPRGEPLQVKGHHGGQFVFHLKMDIATQELQAFEKAKKSIDQGELMQFLSTSKNRTHKKAIRQILKNLESNELWNAVNKRSFAELDEFIDDYPNHPKVEEAKQLLEELLSTPKPKPKPSKIIQPQSHIIKDTNLFTDPRDGQTYKTVKLKDGNIWLAENLSYDIDEGCYFYNNDFTNADKYGRLYTWEVVRKAVPKGWHIPSDDEWKTLVENYGGKGTVSYEALIKGGDSNFAALLGGIRSYSGEFVNLGEYGYYWSATENGASNAWGYDFSKAYGKVYRYSSSKAYAFSCRCVKD